MDRKEYERKFIAYPPDYVEYSSNTLFIVQNYLEWTVESELRIRMTLDRKAEEETFKLGYKRKLDYVENSFEVDRDLGELLLYNCGTLPLSKKRKFTSVEVSGGSYCLSVDFYSQDLIQSYLHNLNPGTVRIAEIEFEDYDQMATFDSSKIPWLGKEVTFDKAYCNLAIWKYVNERQGLL